MPREEGTIESSEQPTVSTMNGIFLQRSYPRFSFDTWVLVLYRPRLSTDAIMVVIRLLSFRLCLLGG